GTWRVRAVAGMVFDGRRWSAGEEAAITGLAECCSIGCDAGFGSASRRVSTWQARVPAPHQGYLFCSLAMAAAALPATTQLAEPATTASSSNQRNPKSSMHSGKSGLMMMYPGITAPGMYELSPRLLLYVLIFETVPTPATYEVLDTGCVPRM